MFLRNHPSQKMTHLLLTLVWLYHLYAQMMQMISQRFPALVHQDPLHLLQGSSSVGIMELNCLVNPRYEMEGLRETPDHELSYFLGTGPGYMIKSYRKSLDSILMSGKLFLSSCNIFTGGYGMQIVVAEVGSPEFNIVLVCSFINQCSNFGFHQRCYMHKTYV